MLFAEREPFIIKRPYHNFFPGFLPLLAFEIKYTVKESTERQKTISIN